MGRLHGILIATLVTAATASPVRAQERVEINRVTGGPVRGALLGLDAKGALRVRTGAENEVVVPQDAIVTAVFSQDHRPAPKGTATVHLASGDHVVAAIEGGNFDEMALASHSVGSFTLFLDHVALVTMTDEMPGGSLDLPAALPGADEDELFLRRGDKLDRLPGEMQRLARTGVVFSSAAAGDDRTFSFMNDRVAAVRLAATDPYEEPETLLCVARFKDGTRLTGLLTAEGTGEMRLKLTVGPQVTIDRTALRSLEFKSTRFRFLSDMKPKSFEEVPYLEGGPMFGLRVDRGFGRQKELRIGDKTYRKGLGIHARAACTFALEGRFDVFRAQVGVDPLTQHRAIPGTVRMRVLADGEEVWASALLVAGGKPVPVEIKNLKGRAELTVMVDFGDSRGTGARAILGEAMVLVGN